MVRKLSIVFLFFFLLTIFSATPSGAVDLQKMVGRDTPPSSNEVIVSPGETLGHKIVGVACWLILLAGTLLILWLTTRPFIGLGWKVGPIVAGCAFIIGGLLLPLWPYKGAIWVIFFLLVFLGGFIGWRRYLRRRPKPPAPTPTPTPPPPSPGGPTP